MLRDVDLTRCDVNAVVVAGNTAYVAPWIATYPGYHEAGLIASIDLETLETKQVVATKENQGTATAMVADSKGKYGYLLVSSSTTSSGQIVKVDLLGLSIVGSTSAGTDFPMSGTIYDDKWLLVGDGSGVVVFVDLDNFETAGQASCGTGQLNTALVRNTSAFLGTYLDGTWCEFDFSSVGVNKSMVTKATVTKDNSTSMKEGLVLPSPRQFTAAKGRSNGLLLTGVPDDKALIFSAADPPGVWDLEAATEVAELSDSPNPQFGNIMSTCVLAHPSKNLAYYGNPQGSLGFTVWTFEYS